MADRTTNVVDFFSTALSSSVAPGDTTFNVDTTTGGPASPCYIIIGPADPATREIIYCDGVFTGTAFKTTSSGAGYRDLGGLGNTTHAADEVVWVAPVSYHIDDLNDRIDALVTALAGKVSASLYDANTIVKADTDNTPEAMPVAEGTLIGRLSGGEITDLEASEVATLLALATTYQARATFPVVIGVALSDETTAITTGTAKVTIRAPYAFTLTSVLASLSTASSSGIPTVDINESGSTILSTKLTIDAGEKTSTTAATAAVISDAAIADDAEITFDIDVAGTGAKGLKVWLVGTRVV